MNKKNILKISLGLFLTVFMASCSKDTMEDINKDKNNPNDVPARFVVTDAIVSSAFSVTGSDYAFYASVYMEHNVGIFGQMYNAERRIAEPYLSSTYNNTWNAVYTNLWALKTVIDKCSPGGSEDGNFQTLAVAQILSAYNLAIQTDLMGDIPWSEALQPGVIFQPKLDKQEAIYADIMKFLDGAILNLEKTTTFASLGKQDLLFEGNSDKWKKFAYGLRARYKMRLSHKAPKYQEVIDDVNKSFANAGEAASFKFNGSTTVNPFYKFYTDRKYFGASTSLNSKLVARNDPRNAKFFAPFPGKPALLAPNGNPEQVQSVYSISGLMSASAPINLLSFHELQFLKAEANARLNNLPAALVALNTGVQAAFVKVGLTSAAADTYFTANVAPLFAANPLKEIAVQKYLSFYEDEAIESYSDYRRLKAMGNGFIDLANTGAFPLRYTYGSSDVTTNNNVTTAYGDGQYVKTENVWWAGGTR